MLKKIGGYVGASAVVVGGFLVKVLIMSGSAAAGHVAVNSFQSHEAKEKAYSDMEQGAKTCFGKAGAKLDDVTTLNSCFFDRSKPEIVYNAVLSYNAADLDIRPSDIAAMKQELANGFSKKLSKASLQDCKNVGMLFTYNYYSQDAKLLMSITLKANDF